MGRGFFFSLATGCTAGLAVAAIDATAGYIASGSRFESIPFSAACAGFTALLVLGSFLIARWLVVESFVRRGAADGRALSVACATGIGALMVGFDVDSPHSNLFRFFEVLVGFAVAVTVGVGAHALAVVDSRRPGTTPSRIVGRALAFAMPFALVAAWMAFVRVDDITSVPFVLIVLALLVIVTAAGRVAVALSARGWRTGVFVAFGLVVAGGVTGAFFLEEEGPFASRRGRKSSGSVSRVIVLTVDTLRRDALSCYGSTSISTPNIDRLAHRGVRFTNVTASSSWTLPTFASMMTGLTTRGHGVDVSIAAIPDTVATLAERFQAAGYATKALVANGILAPHRGFAQGFDRYHLPTADSQPSSMGEALASLLRHQPLSRETSTVDVTNAAIEWTNARRDQDFFLWVHYLDPHLPYTPPETLVERMNIHDEMGLTLDITSATRPTMDLFGEPERRVWARSLYDGEVRHVDLEIGRLLDALEAIGILDDALVVFASDHGEEFWDHDGFEHGHTLYQELVGVPLIFKLPGSRKGLVVEDAVAIYDVAPTVLDLCGLPAVDAPQAISLAGHLDGSPRPLGSRPVFASGTLFRSNFECVVFDGWKYIRSATTGREELYRLTSDQRERTSLVLEHPEVARRGRRLIDEHIRFSEAFRIARGISNPEIELDEEEIERLRSLGYL